MKYLINIGLIVLFCVCSLGMNTNINDSKDDEIRKEIMHYLNSTDFFIDAANSNKLVNVEFTQGSYYIDDNMLYGDAFLDKMADNNLTSNFFCCKNYSDDIKLIIVSNVKAQLNCIICYEYITKNGICCKGKNRLKCELIKEQDKWRII